MDCGDSKIPEIRYLIGEGKKFLRTFENPSMHYRNLFNALKSFKVRGFKENCPNNSPPLITVNLSLSLSWSNVNYLRSKQKLDFARMEYVCVSLSLSRWNVQLAMHEHTQCSAHRRYHCVLVDHAPYANPRAPITRTIGRPTTLKPPSSKAERSHPHFSAACLLDFLRALKKQSLTQQKSVGVTSSGFPHLLPISRWPQSSLTIFMVNSVQKFRHDFLRNPVTYFACTF